MAAMPEASEAWPEILEHLLRRLRQAHTEPVLLEPIDVMEQLAARIQRVTDARRAGVSDEQIVGIQHPGTGPFSSKERLGLAFVDAVVRATAVPDGLVEPLRSMFSEREIGELWLAQVTESPTAVAMWLRRGSVTRTALDAVVY
ncbi:MAG: hypothetical protein JO057_15130 [Chloroflexi bacterium]|nr:hypothetical protein [Chloroflexota bacterium]